MSHPNLPSLISRPQCNSYPNTYQNSHINRSRLHLSYISAKNTYCSKDIQTSNSLNLIIFLYILAQKPLSTIIVSYILNLKTIESLVIICQENQTLFHPLVELKTYLQKKYLVISSIGYKLFSFHGHPSYEPCHYCNEVISTEVVAHYTNHILSLSNTSNFHLCFTCGHKVPFHAM